MSEDISKLLGIGEPPPPGAGRAQRKMPRLALFGLLVCLGWAVFFLLKRESGTYSFTFMAQDNEVHTVATRGVSAVTYYLVWPESRRKAEEDQETAGLYARLLATQQLPTDLGMSLPDRIRHNLRAAAFWGVVAAAVSLFGMITGWRVSSGTAEQPVTGPAP